MVCEEMTAKEEAFKRVTEEFENLSVRIAKLETLLNDPAKMVQLGIPRLQSDLLWAQMRAMKSYQTILAIRIEHWDDE